MSQSDDVERRWQYEIEERIINTKLEKMISTLERKISDLAYANWHDWYINEYLVKRGD